MDKKNIAISGASGLVGSALCSFLAGEKVRIVRLVRGAALGPDQASVDYRSGAFESDKLEGLDALIHLAGESIAALRWTAGKKKEIYESRVLGTRFLCERLAKLTAPPKLLLCASAIGYYGSRGAEILSEAAPPGEGFLARVVCDWEAACESAAPRGIRVVNARLGMVLAAQGGALQKMLPAFRLGLGGVIGSGSQYISWIAIQDVVRAIWHIVQNAAISGSVNLVSPSPVTNLEFTKCLGKVLNRPTIFPFPAFAAKILLGEMADELLLASTRAAPDKLLASGFQFSFPDLLSALRVNSLPER